MLTPATTIQITRFAEWLLKQHEIIIDDPNHLCEVECGTGCGKKLVTQEELVEEYANVK